MSKVDACTSGASAGDDPRADPLAVEATVPLPRPVAPALSGERPEPVGPLPRCARLRPTALEVIVALFCGVGFAAAQRYVVDGNCPLSAGLLVDALTFWLLFVVGFAGARVLLGLRAPRGAGRRVSRACGLLVERHPYTLGALTLLACWAPTLVVMYPGIITQDAYQQLSMVAELPSTDAFTAHHPVLTTLLFGAVILGLMHLGAPWGVALFSFAVLQAVCMALALMRAVRYARVVLGMGCRWSLLSLAFCGLFPFFPLMVAYVVKDTVFCVAFVALMVDVVEVGRTRGAALSSGSFLARLTCLCLLACLTKKVAVYILVIALAIGVIALRRRGLRLLVPLVSSAALMFAVYPAVTTACGISQSDPREMFSLPFQMTARYVSEHPDDVTPEEYEAIDDLLGMDTLAGRYVYDDADYVKFFTDRLDGATTQQYAAWARAWLAEGLRHPASYVDATGAMVAPWFTFDEIDMTFWGWGEQYDLSYVDSNPPDALLPARVFLEERYAALSENPLTCVLVSTGLFATLLPAFFLTSMACDRQTRRHALVPVAVIALSVVLGMWLGPTATFPGNGVRYLFPLVTTAPLMVSFCRSELIGARARAMGPQTTLSC
ncbi:MAG: DUF6020 family protein [Coriobacteriales bacterium]|jgi:hypothetical protein